MALLPIPSQVKQVSLPSYLFFFFSLPSYQ